MLTEFVVGFAFIGIIMLLAIFVTEEELKDAKKRKKNRKSAQ